MQKFREISQRFAGKFFQKVGEISHLFPGYLSRLVYRLQRYRCNRFKKINFFRKFFRKKLFKKCQTFPKKCEKNCAGRPPKNPPEGLQKVGRKTPRFPRLPAVWGCLAHALRIYPNSQFVSKTHDLHRVKDPFLSQKSPGNFFKKKSCSSHQIYAENLPGFPLKVFRLQNIAICAEIHRNPRAPLESERCYCCAMFPDSRGARGFVRGSNHICEGIQSHL